LRHDLSPEEASQVARALTRDKTVGHEEVRVAIVVEFLADQTVYHDSLGAVALVVLTDESGASRVYETRGRMFSRWDSQDGVWDESGARWTLSEPALTGPDQTSLRRLPSHRAFWFGWYAQYPETRLVY
jgi:hypothetical protein